MQKSIIAIALTSLISTAALAEVTTGTLTSSTTTNTFEGYKFEIGSAAGSAGGAAAGVSGTGNSNAYQDATSIGNSTSYTSFGLAGGAVGYAGEAGFVGLVDANVTSSSFADHYDTSSTNGWASKAPGSTADFEGVAVTNSSAIAGSNFTVGSFTTNTQYVGSSLSSQSESSNTGDNSNEE